CRGSSSEYRRAAGAPARCVDCRRYADAARPAAVTERMRVKLGESRPPAESLDDLPDPVVGHTTLLPVASAAAVTHHKHRILTATTNPLLHEVFGHHDFRHLAHAANRTPARSRRRRGRLPRTAAGRHRP